MSTVLWLGGTSTDVGVGANWVGGAVPASGDNAVWNSVTTYGMGSGAFTNPVYLYVTEGAGTATSRDVGTAASPLTLSITATTGVAQFANRGNVYVTSGGTVAIAKFEMPNGSTATLSGGTWTQTTATNVTLEIGASAVMTTIYANGATVNAATNGTAITEITGSGTWTVTTRAITAANLDGPTAKLVTKGTGAVATCTALCGGVFNHQSSGAITTVNLRGRGSTLTPLGNPVGVASVTVANLNRWVGSNFVKAVPGFTFTVTNDNFIGPQSETGISAS